jgi:hypothetical protein
LPGRQDAFAPVVKVSGAGGVVTLATDPISSSLDAPTRSRDDSPVPVLPVLREVLQHSGPGSRLEVLATDGRKQAIIGWTAAQVRMGYGRAVWNALTPSGTP